MKILETDVLVIGAGGAGMYAAISAARAGARVLLADKNMVGRGGATVMAQMTVAAALGEETPDSAQAHLADTVKAGRGLCDAALARVLCEQGPERIREMDGWGAGWARGEDGHIRQVTAPGHDRPRCCYVDFLDTGPAVARTLRRRVSRQDGVTRVSNLAITDLVSGAGAVHGAVGMDVADGTDVAIAARATVIATGGLTRLYARSSASANMSGEGYALALRAGAELVDMEFVQFFPIGHLAPRLVGMDPIMWDPFRYKLGGRLLNGEMQEFVERYGGEDRGRYTATRDLATYAIMREVAAGRGSPAGGAYLDFSHVPGAELRAAFGPVIDRLAANGIDLERAPVEVAPIAHYHMGGVRVDASMRASLDGLLAAGEAVGGASGANRLSGNAITEAFVFGEVAGRSAARIAAERDAPFPEEAARAAIEAASPASPANDAPSAAALLRELRTLMWRDVGPFRDAGGLGRAQERIAALREAHARTPLPAPGPFAHERCEWHEARAALDVAAAVAHAAAARRESRGAHQREDFPETDPAQAHNQVLRLEDGSLAGHLAAPAPGAASAAS